MPGASGMRSMDGGFDKAASLTEICRGIRECKRNVSRKAGVMDAYIHQLAFARNIRDDLLGHRYKLRPGKSVMIYRPKFRIAVAPWFRDRVWQRSMCNNGIYDDLTRSFIYDNIACQKGKGLDLAIRRVIRFLQELHRKDPAHKIYGCHLDIRKYFPSTPHAAIKALDRERIREERYIPFLEEIIDSVADQRSREEIERDPFGERGTGLGSQINQLHQIALLDKMDHEMKTTCRYYIRYNDDILILDHDRSVIDNARRIIDVWLADIGLQMVDKAGTFDVRKSGFYFLRKRFIMKDTGKIVLRMHRDAMKEERKTLEGMKRIMQRGTISMENVRQHYQSWVANAEYAGNAPIRSMDKYYVELFKQKPIYKRKRRYLYGRGKDKIGKDP